MMPLSPALFGTHRFLKSQINPGPGTDGLIAGNVLVDEPVLVRMVAVLLMPLPNWLALSSTRRIWSAALM